MTNATDPDDAEAALDPAAAALILGEGTRIGERLAPDSRVLYGVWGVAWLVGYLALWVTSRDDVEAGPAAWAFSTFYGLLVAAIVITIVHVTRRSRGLRGASATSGMMYGWSWAIAFTVVGLVIGALGRSGVEGPAMGLISNALPCIVVGVLYMAGAAMYREWPWFVLGAWIAVVAGIATTAGMPHTYLVMAVAGGGGMIVGAVLSHVTGAGGRRRP